MEVAPVLKTNDRVRADTACETLRSNRLKCDVFEPQMPDIKAPYGSVGIDDWQYVVVVAVEDEARAREVLESQ